MSRGSCVHMGESKHCDITCCFRIWQSWKTNTEDEEGLHLMLPKFLSCGFLLPKYKEGVWKDICSESIGV